LDPTFGIIRSGVPAQPEPSFGAFLGAVDSDKLFPGLKTANDHRDFDLIRDAATKETAAVLETLKTSAAGLTGEEAAARRAQHGPNLVAEEEHQSWLNRLYVAALNPPVILLTVPAIVAFATDSFLVPPRSLCCWSACNLKDSRLDLHW
jgi:magnesium-transporting ATPase (P-type)